MRKIQLNKETQCVHPINEPQKDGTVTSPVYASTAYTYTEGEELLYPGFSSTYNQQRLSSIIARLENADFGSVCNSGMAAISSTILSTLNEGDHVIFSQDLYGGTMKFASDELPQRGIACSFAANSLESFESCRQGNTRLIYIESPSNPLLRIMDLKQLAEWARKHHLITVIDSTFATPVNQQPLALGIDVVVHSGTKYLGGHNDLMFGAMVTNNKELHTGVMDFSKLYGLALSPSICQLAERSIKTLSLRVQQQNQSALQIATHLEHHPRVSKVYYPGLASHPQHHLAKQQMKGYGGMVSFEIDCKPEAIRRFFNALRFIQPALSLGGVESLISVPAVTSHVGMTHEQRLALGIRENLIRLSVGIEHSEDLMEDLTTALNSL